MDGLAYTHTVTQGKTMKKGEADKAREKLQKQIRRELRKGTKVLKIAADTGYTSARIYQIKAQMVYAGELEASK